MIQYFNQRKLYLLLPINNTIKLKDIYHDTAENIEELAAKTAPDNIHAIIFKQPH